jgi:hypothetical protein
MNKLSFKDLVPEEAKKVNRVEDLWTPIELPVREEKKVEYKISKPRNGIKSLLDFNEDIKPVKNAVIEPLTSLLEPVTETAPVINEQELVEEILIPEPIIEPVITLADRAVDHITKEVKLEEQNDSYQQPDSSVDVRSFNDVKKKIQFLQDWISKISLAGPGGGAGDVINLDHPVKLITANYTFTRKDYYVGVNATSTITITIPDSLGFPGRMVIIKDESGNCSNNPITVDCTVDNDTGGFILAQNNGGIQMIYREGWRIV